MDECVFCQHPRSEHYGTGCSKESLRHQRCTCRYVDVPPLPPGSATEACRERSDWWYAQAQTADRLARRLRFDLHRWRALMHFLRSARQAEIAARQLAEIRGSAAGAAARPVPRSDDEQMRAVLAAAERRAAHAAMLPSDARMAPRSGHQGAVA